MIILANVALTVAADPAVEGDEEPVEACTARIHRTRGGLTSLDITGMYVPYPRVRQVTMEHLAKLPGSNRKSGARQNFPRLVTGDSNPPEWEDLFDEWRCEMDFWQLNHPGAPTHMAGGVLDRARLYPGEFAIAEWFPDMDSAGAGRGEHRGDEVFPARVYGELAFSAHFPVLLVVPWERQKVVRRIERLEIEGLTQEDWLARNARLEEQLVGEGLLPAGDVRDLVPANQDHYYFRLEAIVKEIFSSGRRSHCPPLQPSPLQQFLLRNERRPETDDLLAALELDLRKTVAELMDRIRQDGWHQSLGKVGRNNTKSLFRYLAKEFGDTQWDVTVEDLAPIKVWDKIILGGWGQSEAIADYFESRLSVPKIEGQGERIGGEVGPRPVRQVEVWKAAQAGRHASGVVQKSARISAGAGGRLQRSPGSWPLA